MALPDFMIDCGYSSQLSPWLQFVGKWSIYNLCGTRFWVLFMSNLPIPSQKNTHFPTREILSVLLHGWLDGSNGANRNRSPGAVKQITADTDIEAIEDWLKSKRRKSLHTQRAYHREAYRLLAWSVAFKDKPLSSLSVDDIAEFHDWLESPVNHPVWEERGWILFRGPLSPVSRRHAIIVLIGLFRWLVEAGYLAGNPVKLFDGGSAAEQQKEEKSSEQEHFLPHDLWQWVNQHLDAQRPGNNRGGAINAYERQRFIVTFLYWTGLRRSELASAVMARIRQDGSDWVLKVKGKGRIKLEPVVLLQPAMAALRRYRLHRGLPEYPTPAEEETPLVPASDGITPISDNYLNRLLKCMLGKLAAAVPNDHPGWAEKLRSATAHWMRHSLATHNAEAGVTIEATADQLRHKSMETTRRIYTHVKARHRRKELAKLLNYESE